VPYASQIAKAILRDERAVNILNGLDIYFI